MSTETVTTCSCGKRAWPTQHDADQVVLRAKIAVSLRGNAKRREQRSYQCPKSPGTWHVTSVSVAAPLPQYGPGDDAEAEEFIGRFLNRPNDDTWAALIKPERIDQTVRVLGRIHQVTLARLADKKAARVAVEAQGARGLVPRGVVEQAKSDHADWVRRVAHFQAATLARLEEARQVLKRVNLARSTEKNAEENHRHRDALRRLALAVAAHRDATDVPTQADKELWAWLGVLAVPHGGDSISVAELLDSGTWT